MEILALEARKDVVRDIIRLAFHAGVPHEQAIVEKVGQLQTSHAALETQHDDDMSQLATTERNCREHRREIDDQLRTFVSMAAGALAVAETYRRVLEGVMGGEDRAVDEAVKLLNGKLDATEALRSEAAKAIEWLSNAGTPEDGSPADELPLLSALATSALR